MKEKGNFEDTFESCPQEYAFFQTLSSLFLKKHAKKAKNCGTFGEASRLLI